MANEMFDRSARWNAGRTLTNSGKIKVVKTQGSAKRNSSSGRNAARVGVAATIITAGGGGFFEDLYQKLTGDHGTDLGAALDLPGLVGHGNFEVIEKAPYAPQKKSYFSIASAAEDKTDYWGEWKYLMDGKPTDSWYESAKREFTYFYKLLTDSKFAEFVSKMKSGNTITAYAIATGKTLEGLTEEQKKAIACSDAIYAAGADECKTVSADNPKQELGGKPGQADLEAAYKDIVVGDIKLGTPSLLWKYSEAESKNIKAMAVYGQGDDFFVLVDKRDGADLDKEPARVNFGISNAGVMVNVGISGSKVKSPKPTPGYFEGDPNEPVSGYKDNLKSAYSGNKAVLQLPGLKKFLSYALTKDPDFVYGLGFSFDDNEMDHRASQIVLGGPRVKEQFGLG